MRPGDALAVVQEPAHAKPTVDRRAQLRKVAVGSCCDEPDRALHIVVAIDRGDDDLDELLAAQRRVGDTARSLARAGMDVVSAGATWR